MKSIRKTIPLIIIATTILTTGCEKKLEILQKEPTTYKKADKLKGNLYAVHKGKKLPTQMPPAEYYLVYTSASWCGPCIEFNKTLIPVLERRNLEVILIAADNTPKNIYKYVENKPFFVVDTAAIHYPDWINKIINTGNTIPKLAIIKNNGELEYNNKDPKKVLIKYLELI